MLAFCEMLTTSAKIWTQVDKSISYDDILFTMSISFHFHIYDLQVSNL